MSPPPPLHPAQKQLVSLNYPSRTPTLLPSSPPPPLLTPSSSETTLFAMWKTQILPLGFLYFEMVGVIVRGHIMRIIYVIINPFCRLDTFNTHKSITNLNQKEITE